MISVSDFSIMADLYLSEFCIIRSTIDWEIFHTDISKHSILISNHAVAINFGIYSRYHKMSRNTFHKPLSWDIIKDNLYSEKKTHFKTFL